MKLYSHEINQGTQPQLSLAHQATCNLFQPQIRVIETGGTISCSDEGKGLTPTIELEEMIQEYLPATVSNIKLSYAKRDERDHFGELIDSANIQPEHWIRLAELTHQAIDAKVDGVLILTGTDTMAYTAAALSILVDSRIPVVITGSQYPFGHANSDARDNFMHGLTAAIIEQPGVYAVFGGELYLANQIHKISSISPKAFTAINPEHSVDSSAMRFATSPDLLSPAGGVKVELIVPGYEPCWLESLLADDSIKGIVLVGYGAGGLPTEGDRSLVPILSRYSGTKPVVIVSQTIQGGVDLSKYEVGQKLLSAGVISAGAESLEYASFKLKYLLAHSCNIDEIRRAFKGGSYE
jgi:L-asparaginase